MVRISDEEWLRSRDDLGMSVTANKGSLSSVQVRIERAKTHLTEFDKQAMLIAEACRVTRAIDKRSSEHVFRASKVPPIPPGLSAIIGDAIHNLRVSLDYLAWQLVIATGRKAPNGDTHFPILKKPDADRAGKILPNIKPDVSSDVRILLDEIQPYQWTYPRNHFLELLRVLDNSDKHHDLLVTVVAVRDMGWWGDAEPTWFDGAPSEGAEICRFRNVGCDGDFEPTLRFDVGLREPGAGAWAPTLGAADLVRLPLRYIEDEVVPRLRGFLDR